MLLGRYENFPQNIHGIALFQYQNSPKSLQQAILFTFHGLNNKKFDLSAVTPYTQQKCEVGFEFGMADGFDFVFLDQNELDLCLKSVEETEQKVWDFFLSVRYHLVKDGGKRVPLRFDYHVLRFVFRQEVLELQIRHERGTQHVPLDDLTDFLVKQINVELSQKGMLPLFFGNFEKIKLQ